MGWGLLMLMLVLSAISSSSESDTRYCDSWRLLAVETNNAGNWGVFPGRCKEHVEEYMSGNHYVSDSDFIANFSFQFANQVYLQGNGRDAWIFDVDDTLLSNLPYYTIHGFGSKKSKEMWFEEWVNLGEAPALEASLRLYNELHKMGFTIFLLTGRHENQRAATEANLLSQGYSHWKRLILRGPKDEYKTAKRYKSEKRAELVKEGYIIHGSSGDQWSDLLGFPKATRSFKLPNPVYYIE